MPAKALFWHWRWHLGLSAAGLAIAITPAHAAPKQEPLFSEAGEDISLENKNRRKWGNPVIADLDQDGYLDLLLTDHGYAVKLYWNNKGQYTKGWDLIVGDTHGIAVADYDEDGEMNIMVTRGGGSGSNNRSAKIYSVTRDRKISDAMPFSKPLKNMRGRTADFRDGDGDGDLDLYLLGFPSVPKIKGGENYVYKNDDKGDLTFNGKLAETGADGEGLLITDFDNDNIIDLIFYGGRDSLSVHQGDGRLGYKTVTDAVLPYDIRDVTSVTEFDYDNDGDFDLYIARGKGFRIGETFYDSKTRTFAFYTKRGKFQFGDFKIGDTFRMENYQAPWPHQKIFTGEAGLEFTMPGEKHSGRDFEIVSSDALGWVDNPDKKGLYLGYVGNDNWRIAGETFSPTTGVIKGVKSYPAYNHEAGPTDILLENKGGKFVDVTEQAGLLFAEHSTGVAAGDYDNDGYQDLVIIKRGNLATSNKQIVFLNRGDGTFARFDNHGIVSTELGASGMGVEAFDYDQNGGLDILYSNERGRWHLFRNDLVSKKGAQHLTVRVGVSPSGEATALGAVVAVEACGKNQIRRIGSSGAPYSQSFNNLSHFGLGQCRQSANISVRWPNGEQQKLRQKNEDNFLIVGTLPE